MRGGASVLVLLLACGGDAPPAGPPPTAAPKPAAAPASSPPPTPPPAPEPAANLPCDGFALPATPKRSPIAVASTPELERARATLDKVVRAHGIDGENPWAIGHALVALGKDVELPDGTRAVDHLFSRFGEEIEVGGRRLVRFPRSEGDIRIEPHTDLLLKAFAEVGVPADHPVQVDGKPHTVADLVCHSLHRSWVDGEKVSFDSWNDTPWALQGLTTYAVGDRTWTAAGGHPMTLDGFTDAVVDRHHREVAFIRDAMAKGETFQKQRQGIFGYTCGGAHLLQGAAYGVARGYGSDDTRAHLEADVATWFARYAVEMQMLDAAIQQYPEHRLRLFVQRLKFLGHFTESMHKLAAAGLLEPDEQQRRILDAVLKALLETVVALEGSGVLDKLPELRAADEQLFLDVVGDSAHALHGLDLATGRVGVLL